MTEPIDYDDIIAAARAHIEGSAEDPEEYQRMVLGLAEGALENATTYEVAHTLAFSLGLLTPEEREDEELWKDPTALLEGLVKRLEDTPIQPEQFVSLLVMEANFGIRVGMEVQRRREGGS